MKQRIITGVLGGIGFLLLVYIGKEWYSLLVLALALIGLFEFLQIAGIKPFGIGGLLSYLLMISILLPELLFTSWIHVPFTDMLITIMILLLVYSVLQKNKFHIEHVALSLIGALYIGFGFSYMAAMRNIPDLGLVLTVLVILGIWATDSGAYFVGKAMGKRKLWPAISPNKTVEGSVGGLLFAIVIVFLVNALVGQISPMHALTIALIAGIAGQMGDLVESAFKRHFGVKDSGQILPGHGGVLDRCDSWLFVFPILHLFGLI